MPYKSRYSVNVPSTTSLPSFIFNSPTASPSEEDRVFIDCKRPDTVYLTLHSLREWSKRIAAGLLAAGRLKAGERVLLWSGNNIFFPAVVHGVIMAGGIVTTANPSFTALELAHQLKDADVSLMLAAEAYLGTALDGARLAGLDRRRVFVFNDAPFYGRGEDQEGLQHWRRLIASPEVGREFVWEEFTTEEQAKRPIILLYSSGTTGPPKGVVVSHFNIIANTCQTALMQDTDPRTSQGNARRGLCFLPMYHGLSLVYFGLMAPKNGLTVYMMERYELMLMMENIQSFQITELLTVPPIVVSMAKHPLLRSGNYDISSVRKVVCGAAPLGSEISQQFEQLWPAGQMKINQGWGMSEIPCMLLGWHDRKVSASTLTSVGELLANCEAKIMDEDGVHEVPRGTRGEMWCRAPNVMNGYWRNAEATTQTMDDEGWLKTGDIAYVDEDENFFIVDRKKELIKVKGNQVAPADLEALLLKHPNILDAAVVGAKITEEDERPRAYVVAKPGSSLTEEQVMTFMAERVAKIKRITGGVVFVDVIPKNVSGKILRKLLRIRAAEELKANPRSVAML